MRSRYIRAKRLLLLLLLVSVALGGCAPLAEVRYAGTQAMWDAIEKADGWNTNCGGYVLLCAAEDRAAEAESQKNQ